MLKSNQDETPNYNVNPDPSHHPMGIVAHEGVARGAVPTLEQAVIAKGLTLKGEITGTESLYVDGRVEGSISLPGSRVTVGRNGQVNANISAREIVVMGKVQGNVSASDSVNIRAEGGVTGDVTAARISIEDGAFFKGGIDIRKPAAKPTLSDFVGMAAAKEAISQP
jgi:cytoskeletal protein CcmA (bactofilin family)